MEKMNINRTNYETFFIDYLEGTLNKEDREKVEVFLSANPDLRRELESIHHLILTPGNMEYPDKHVLIKEEEGLSITGNVADDRYIAYHEGDLNEKQAGQLLHEVQDSPEKKQALEGYGKLFLKPDLSVEYTNKQSLKKGTRTLSYKRVLYTSLSLAASLFIGFLIFRNANNDIAMQAGQQAETINQEMDPPARDNNTFRPDVKAGENSHADPNREQPLAAADINPSEQTDANEQGHTTNPDAPKPGSKKTVDQDNRVNPEIAKTGLSKLKSKQVYQLESADPGKIIAVYGVAGKDTNYGNKEYLTVTEYLAKTFREDVLKKENPEDTRITALDILAAGINGLGNMTGKDIKLNREYNRQGKLEKLSLDTESFALNLPINKNK